MSEFTEFWRHPRFVDLGMLKASFRAHRYHLHTHPTYVIALITNGCERIRIGNVVVNATPGTIAIVNPEECHDGEAATETGWSYLTLYPTVELMSSICEGLGQTGVATFSRPLIDDPELARCFLTAHETSRDSDGIRAEASLMEALRELILRHGANVQPHKEPVYSGARSRLLLYEQLIEDNIGSEFDLDFFAAAAGVTKFQVIRDFKKCAGLTPAAYVRIRKLRYAAAKIEQGYPLAEAGLEAGFFDQSHLSRVFRNIHGITPGAFQSASRTSRRR